MNFIFKNILPFVALAGICQAETEAKKPVYRDAATHDSIVKKVDVSKKANPMQNLTPAQGEDTTVKIKPPNLISSSDIISFNGFTTIVPKTAIIQMPERLKDRINNHTPGNKILNWIDFYSRNRGWITTIPVSVPQAEGKEPLAEEVIENLKKDTNLVVATYANGPVTMLTPKKQEEAKTE